MKNYLAPLGVFIACNICLLGMFLFLSDIGTMADTLETQTAAYNGVFWNWSWAVSNTEFFIYIFGEIMTLFFTLIAFLKSSSIKIKF